MKHAEYGLSIYPDFYGIEAIKNQVERAAELGYTRVFTSIQLGNLGFENTKEGVTDEFKSLFERCAHHHLILHVDINDRVLASLGGSPLNLKPIHDFHIQVLRLDGGFTDDEVAQMTHNPYGIRIEDNTSMVKNPRQRLETIKAKGNLQRYVACHNFFPRNDTGLDFDEAVRLAHVYADYGCQNGIFIASLHSPNDLNASGNGVPTVEEHRYVPSHIAFSELRNTGLFDYILFGDSVPRDDELVAVARVANAEVVEIPVWLDGSLRKDLRQRITETVFLSRPDQPVHLIRATQTRGNFNLEPHQTVQRHRYAITLDNRLSNRYEGELQILLDDLPPSPVANVIGQVKPVAKRLLKQIMARNLPFVLKEDV